LGKTDCDTIQIQNRCKDDAENWKPKSNLYNAIQSVNQSIEHQLANAKPKLRWACPAIQKSTKKAKSPGRLDYM